MDERLKHIMELMGKIEPEKEDYSSWSQVGVLNTESKTLRRSIQKMMDKNDEEMNLLIAKRNALQAKAEMEGREYWNKIYKIHSLPVDRMYHIEEDGRILMGGKKEKV